MTVRNWILVGVLAFLPALPSFGGALGERNKAVAERSEKKKESEKKKSSSGSSAATSSFGSGTYPSSSSDSSSGFFGDMVSWLIMAPFAYRQDDPAASLNPEGSDGWAESGGHSIFPIHETGQATVPYIRADYHYQWAEDVDADDIRIEGGYKFIGAQARFTRYVDAGNEDLRNHQYYLMLRYGGNRPDFVRGSFEAAVGFGLVHHSGTSLSNYGLDEDTSGALTFSLKYYPFDWVGVEFRPSWWRLYDIVHGDYDLSASLGYNYLQLRGGYRWIWENGVGITDALSGPYAGVSLSF
jgi:hypothetical protein